jgi:predicted GH43/DUF377 family glycosyl hydrolase
MTEIKNRSQCYQGTVLATLLLAVHGLSSGTSMKAKTPPVIASWANVIHAGLETSGGGSIANGFSSGFPVALGDNNVFMIYASAPENELVGVLSMDGGRTWQPRGIIEKNPDKKIKMGRPIAVLGKDGTIWVFYYGWIRYTGVPENSENDLWVVHSADGGKTWCGRQEIWKGYAGMLQGAVATRSGALVLPFTYLVEHSRFVDGCIVSSDRGGTWKFIPGVIDIPPDLDVARRVEGLNGGAIEPTIVQLNDGRLWLLTRTITGKLWQSYSQDDGLTWSKATPSGLSCGGVLYMTKLGSGRLLLIWNRADWSADAEFHFPKDFHHISMALSDDDGKTWAAPIVFATGDYEVHSFAAEPSPGRLLITLPSDGILALGSEESLMEAEDKARSSPSSRVPRSISDLKLHKVRGLNTGGAVLGLGQPGQFDDLWATCPSVLYDGTTYRMWYSSLYDSKMGQGGIGLATSSDGTHWKRVNGGRPVLGLGPEGSFDDGQVMGPSVLRDGGRYLMWYTGMNALWGSSGFGFYRIGLATSRDGVHWTRSNGGKPVLDLGPVGSYDEVQVGTPSVLRVGDEYIMWYAAWSPKTQHTICVAKSQDGIHWERQNQGKPVSGLWVSYAYGPAVAKIGSYYLMLYMSSLHLAPGLYAAWSTDGLQWRGINDGSPILSPGQPGDFDDALAGHACLLHVRNHLKVWYTGYRKEEGGIVGWKLRIGLAEAVMKENVPTPPRETTSDPK